MAETSFEIVEGPDTGRLVPVDGTLIIGRSDDAHVLLQDDLVSRRHAKVTPVQGGAVIEDLESRNGTFVNGNELFGPVQLEPGDQVLVGITLLQLRSDRQIATQPSAVRAVPAAFASPSASALGGADGGDPFAPPTLATPPRRPDYVPSEIGSGAPESPLDPLLDVFTKTKARTAPIAIFVIAVLAILVLLATR